MNFPLSRRSILAFKDRFRLHESIGANRLHSIFFTVFRRLEKLRKSEFFILLSEPLQLSIAFILLFLLLRFFCFTPIFSVSLGLIGSVFLVRLCRSAFHFITGSFKRNFNPDGLNPLPGECCRQRSNENADRDFQDVVHVGSPLIR